MNRIQARILGTCASLVCVLDVFERMINAEDAFSFVWAVILVFVWVDIAINFATGNFE